MAFLFKMTFLLNHSSPGQCREVENIGKKIIAKRTEKEKTDSPHGAVVSFRKKRINLFENCYRSIATYSKHSNSRSDSRIRWPYESGEAGGGGGGTSSNSQRKRVDGELFY